MRKSTIELEGKHYLLHLTFRGYKKLESVLGIDTYLDIYENMQSGKMSMDETLNILLVALEKEYPELDMDKMEELIINEGYSSKQIMEKVILAIGEEMQAEKKEKKEKVAEKKN